MKKNYALFTCLLISIFCFGQKISEFEPNPAGSDPMDTTFELTGTANTSFDLWILSIESDGFNGLVDRAANVTGSFDANGRAVVMVPDLENPSFTVVLTDAFTGSTMTDIDPANDGNLDTSTFGTILDAVGISDSTSDDSSIYGVLLGGSNILFNGEFEPLLVFRDENTGDWYNTVTINFGQPEEDIAVFDAAGNAVPDSNFNIDPTSGPTYGTANPVNTALSVSKNKIEGFSMYPNPTQQDFVNISSKSNTVMDVQVFDIIGKQILNETISDNTLNISKLKTGIYLVRAEQNNAVSIEKLVVK